MTERTKKIFTVNKIELVDGLIDRNKGLYNPKCSFSPSRYDP